MNLKRTVAICACAITAFTAGASQVVSFKDAAKIKSWDAWNDHEKKAAITNILQKEKRSITWERFNKVDPGLGAMIGRIKTRTSPEIKSSKWSVDCGTLDRDYAIWDNYKELLPMLGVKHARFCSGWAKTEQEAGVYDFSWLDKPIRECAAMSIKPWMLVGYGNPVYGSDFRLGMRVRQLTDNPEAMKAWIRYVKALVSRYQDVVDGWEVWNEPFWQEHDYAELFYQTAKAIREVQPTAKVYCAALSDFPQYETVLERLKRENAIGLCSGLMFHPYISNPDKTYRGKKDAWMQLRRLAKRYSPDLDMIQGEVGSPSQLEFAHALANREWTEYKQAKYDLRRVFGDAVRDVPSNCFSFIDLQYTFMLQSFGLVRSNTLMEFVYRRPAWYAMRNFYALFDDDTKSVSFKERAVGEHTLAIAEFTRGGKTMKAFWFSEEIPTDNLEFTRLDLSDEVTAGSEWIEMITGRKYRLSDARSVPVWDSPCLVVEDPQASQAAAAQPTVGRVAPGERVAVDGKLNEASWANAVWNGEFSRLANSTLDKTVTAQTSFAMAADDETLYVAIKCDEPDMASMKTRKHGVLHACNQVELFLSPGIDGFDYYQFVIGFDPRSGSEALFASEGGLIHPDPYGGEWRFARGEYDGGWCVELAVPLSSFYMTRNSAWRDIWRVNVARRWANLGRDELTTWSRLERGFREPASFRTVGGFPARPASDDVGITDAVAQISERRGGKLQGTLSFTATVAEAGVYDISTSFSAVEAVSLKSGVNTVSLPCAYPANGRYDTRIELKRRSNGRTYVRSYPVVVDFEEIRLALTLPEFRNNFYPGQDASRVKGRIASAGVGDVYVTLEGPGFARREARLPQGGGEINFDTTGFQDGTAILKVAVGDVRKEYKVRKLAKTERTMAWISKGNIVIDGKPVLRRDIYAQGYRGGKAFAERFNADKNLYLTPEVKWGGTIEPNRVIKGLEMREARRDVVPCKEYFEKIDALIEKAKDKDYAYWYISDEPECRGVSPVYLRHIYEYMKEKDPGHLVLMASRGGKKYIDCADWFETHPYLGVHYDGHGNRQMNRPPTVTGSFLDAFEAWGRPDKCIGFLPTMFAYKSVSPLNDYPTFEEYVCHVWAAMLRGAKSLWPFFYSDMGDRAALYEGNRYVNSSLAALEDFILFGERKTIVKKPEIECVRWDLAGGKSMFALVNLTSYRQPVTLPAALSDRQWLPFRGQWAAGRALEPYEVVVGVTEERGGDLPTYSQTQALISKLEGERTGRDNQILEKYKTTSFAASNGKGKFYKLIDGTRDVWGWGVKAKSPWVELSFTEKPVAFSRLRVYGSGLEGMKVSIRSGGEWKDIAAKKVTREKYCTDLDFGETLTTVKLRITFGGGDKRADVELYEIELPSLPVEATPIAAAPQMSLPAVVDPENVLWSLCEGPTTVQGKVSYPVKLDPQYEWLELQIDSFNRQKQGAYSAWKLWFLKDGALAGGVTHPQAGRYVLKLPKVETPRKATLRLDDYNFDIGLSCFRCVKRPADFILAEAADGAHTVRPGGRLNVTLTLAQPCADIAASLLIDRSHGRGLEPFLLNGTNALELKATPDGGGRVWTASIPVVSCDESGKKKVYVKCIVLGGALTTPIMTTVSGPFMNR